MTPFKENPAKISGFLPTDNHAVWIGERKLVFPTTRSDARIDRKLDCRSRPRTNIDTLRGEFYPLLTRLVASAANRGAQRVLASGVPAHHSLSRTTLIAAAVRRC